MMARVAELGKTVDDLKATLETKEEEYTQMEDEVDTLREIVKTREVQMSLEQDTAEKAKKSEIELKNQI